METRMREELDRDELNGNGDKRGARRGGCLHTCVHMLGATLLSCPTTVDSGTDPTAVCASTLGTCWR
jgi:hypothetical protein